MITSTMSDFALAQLITDRPRLWRCYADWDFDCQSVGADQSYAEAAAWYLEAISGDPERCA